LISDPDPVRYDEVRDDSYVAVRKRGCIPRAQRLTALAGLVEGAGRANIHNALQPRCSAVVTPFNQLTNG
jgi:hypothetical protein